MNSQPMGEPLASVLSHFKGVRRCSDGWEALCPAHDDNNPSLTIGWGDKGTVVLCCQKSCETADVLAAAGLTFSDLYPEAAAKAPSVRPPAAARGKRRPLGKITDTYDYCDEDGQLLYQVVRYDPKDFSQRKPNGKGGWIWKVGGVRRVPYQLPSLLEAIRDGRAVFIVEGEKDADTLRSRGFVATCNAGGAEGGARSGSRWTPDMNEHFRGARVVILPDNDDTGLRHAQHIASQLSAVAAEVSILELPLGPRLPKHGKDVSDWFAEGHTAEELRALAKARERWKQTDPPRLEFVTGELCNDYGNARRLVRMHGEELRYVSAWGRWMVWEGNRWRRDEDGAAERLAKRTALSIFDEAKAAGAAGDDPKHLSKWANSSLSGPKIREMLATAKTEAEVVATTDDFDVDPWLLNVENGTVNLQTGKLDPHRRADMITKLAPVTYAPEARCPLWEAFLDRIMDGNQELIGFLQRAAGYSLSGTTREQCLFMPYGTGANGKSKFLGTISTLLGDYADTAESSTFLNKGQDTIRNDLAKLVGSRFVTAIEVDQGRRIAEALVKQVTGEDPITARFLHREYFSFLPQFKIWLATNHKPSIRGGDHGMWRRIHLIPFTVTIPVEERDLELGEKLKAELPGILNWAIQGCLQWQRDGLDVPEIVRAATAEYESEMDPLGGFFADCVVSVEDDPTSSAALWPADAGFDPVPAIQLYRAYTAWCEANGERALSNRTFGDKAKQRGVQWKRINSGNVYLGIKLVQGSDGCNPVFPQSNPRMGDNPNNNAQTYTTLHQRTEKIDLNRIFDS